MGIATAPTCVVVKGGVPVPGQQRLDDFQDPTATTVESRALSLLLTNFQGNHVQAVESALNPPPVQQPYLPILVAGGGEGATLRFVADYADASSMGAASWAGGTFTPADMRHKFDVLHHHCQQIGRPPQAVLRTGLLSVFLSDSAATLAARMAHVPAHTLPFFEQLPVIGTPEEAVPRTQALLDAGFQYIIFIVLPVDTESPRLLAERELPALTGHRDRAPDLVAQA